MYHRLTYSVNNIAWSWCGKSFLDFRKLVSPRSVELPSTFERLSPPCLYVITNGRSLAFCPEIYRLMLTSHFFTLNIHLHFKGNSVGICDFECSLYLCDEETGQTNRDGKPCIVNGRVTKVHLQHSNSQSTKG